MFSSIVLGPSENVEWTCESSARSTEAAVVE